MQKFNASDKGWADVLNTDIEDNVGDFSINAWNAFVYLEWRKFKHERLYPFHHSYISMELKIIAK